jgi:hypothetical protein
VARVLASLFILFLGYEIWKEREFLRSLSSKWSKFGVFISIEIYRYPRAARGVAVDEKLKQEISQLFDVYNNWLLVTPTTFYTNTCDELSSRGYQSYLDFYTYLQDLRSKFVRFWINRVFYHDQKILVDFVTNDENLFYSKSQVPKNYWKRIKRKETAAGI